jgi:predicted MPP superfamily phosphohydrolase
MAAAPLALQFPLTAIAVLALLQAFVWLLMVHGMVVAPFRVQVTQLHATIDKFAGGGQPVRIVQISDLHVERLTRRERELPSMVEKLGPDLIVLTGDFMSTSYHDDPRSLADLEVVLGQLSAPGGIYAVWGTAEVDLPNLLRPSLEKLGIIVLENDAVALEMQGHSLWLMGLTCSRDLAADGAQLRGLLEASSPGMASVLLYHTPDLMPQAVSLGVDLYLAGHTHGGQWRVPGFGAILTSSRYWKRYEAGAYRDGSTLLYVSRGLGMEGFGTPRARFFCPPELVEITLWGAPQGEVAEE